MPRSILFFSLAVTALVVVGLALHALHKPEAYWRQKKEAVEHAMRLYAVLGDEVPAFGVTTTLTVASDGFTYTVCMVDVYDSGGARLATFTMDMFSHELIQVVCSGFRLTALSLTREQAYCVAHNYAHSLGLMVRGCPWKLIRTETSMRTPHIRFCWAMERCLIRVVVDSSNSRLVLAETHKLSPKGYIPH